MMDFEDLLQLLTSKQVKFIVVGGVACALNGFVRATEDVDIIVDASENNIQKLIETLVTWGEGYARELNINDFPLSPGAIRVIENFPLDIFTILNDQTYTDLLPTTNKNPQGILFLNPESLIKTKKDSLREKDKLDILALQKIIEEK